MYPVIVNEVAPEVNEVIVSSSLQSVKSSSAVAAAALPASVSAASQTVATATAAVVAIGAAIFNQVKAEVSAEERLLKKGISMRGETFAALL